MDHETKHEFDRLRMRLDRIVNTQRYIMATIDQVLQDVTDESTAIDSVSALISGLKQQLADALSGATIPPAVQAKVDAVFATAEANKAKLATALATNVPPVP
jgi:altronate dehydratase